MKEFIVKAPAKVNLSLDVIRKRSDGYHEMKMVNHSIALADTLIFRPEKEEIKLSCSAQEIPADKSNLVYKMAETLKKKYNIKEGVCIDIFKNIPSEAGLAGGSADAAAALLGLNVIWKLGMDLPKMYALGSKVGADVPYCCFKRTALVEGIGEIITPIKPLCKMPVLVIKPDINIATPWAFNALDAVKNVDHPNISEVVRLVEAKHYDALGTRMGNAFEQVVFKVYPEIRQIKEKILELGAFGSIMSGSGSTVVGYFRDIRTAENAFDVLEKHYKLTFLTEIEIED